MKVSWEALVLSNNKSMFRARIGLFGFANIERERQWKLSLLKDESECYCKLNPARLYSPFIKNFLKSN